MKLYQVVVRNRITGKCIQSVEIYADSQRIAIKNAIGFYPEFAAKPAVYKVSIKVIQESFSKLRRLK